MTRNSRILRYGIGTILVIGLSGVSTLASAQQTMADGLVSQLQRLGWQTEQTEEGLLVTPPAVPQREAQPAGTGGPEVPDVRAGFKARLRELGWRIEESTDGTLTFYPPAPESGENRLASDPQTAARPRAAAKKHTATRVEDRARVPVEALKAAGWQARREADGALLLIPSAVDDQALHAVTAARQRAVTISKDAGRGETSDSDSVSLFRAGGAANPIHTASQATEVARDWLAQSALNNVQPGRVRKILNLFLISIVSDTAPYRLHHQVIVRAQDGLLVAIY